MSDLQKADFSKELPDLSESKSKGFDLAGSYWTPEKVGEEKRMFFTGFVIEKVPTVQGDGLVDLEVARFIEVVNGDRKMVSQGSKRLVSTLQNYNIEEGTPLLIVYQGKKKNKTNSFESDTFSIIPLSI